MFDELEYGDIFIERDETTPYMRIEQISDEYKNYNAVCLMDGTTESFDPYDRVFKYKQNIELNAEDFIGDEREG